MEKGEGRDLMKRYGVDAFPTMFLLDGDGNIIYKIRGGRSVQAFMTAQVEDKSEIPFIQKNRYEAVISQQRCGRLLFLYNGRCR